MRALAPLALLLSVSGCTATILATGPGTVRTRTERGFGTETAPKQIRYTTTEVTTSAAGPLLTLDRNATCDVVVPTTERSRWTATPATSGLLVGGIVLDGAVVGSQVAAMSLHDDPDEVRPWAVGVGGAVVVGSVIGGVVRATRAGRKRPSPVVTHESTEVDCGWSSALVPVSALLLPERAGHPGWAVSVSSERSLRIPGALAGRALLLGPSPIQGRWHVELTASTGDVTRMGPLLPAEEPRDALAWICEALADTSEPLPPTALLTHAAELERACLPDVRAAAREASCAATFDGPGEQTARARLCP